MSQKPRGPLRYDSLSRIAFIQPTIDAQKAPTWSCRDCYRDSNFACRLACFCGFRPGKSHEDKAWHAYRKAQAVPLPNPHRLAKAGGLSLLGELAGEGFAILIAQLGDLFFDRPVFRAQPGQQLGVEQQLGLLSQ